MVIAYRIHRKPLIRTNSQGIWKFTISKLSAVINQMGTIFHIRDGYRKRHRWMHWHRRWMENEHLEENFCSNDKVAVLSHMKYSESSHACEVYGMSVGIEVKQLLQSWCWPCECCIGRMCDWSPPLCATVFLLFLVIDEKDKTTYIPQPRQNKEPTSCPSISSFHQCHLLVQTSSIFPSTPISFLHLHLFLVYLSLIFGHDLYPTKSIWILHAT